MNTVWGGVTEDNSFGTHEYLELAARLGTEPFIARNAGSGAVREMADWREYVDFPGISPTADLRRENGRDQPCNVRMWGWAMKAGDAAGA